MENNDIRLTEKEAEAILAYADADMKARNAALVLGIANTSIVRRFEAIRERTGLDPRCFYDLVELLEAVANQGHD